jgi:hypothetical protein
MSFLKRILGRFCAFLFTCVFYGLVLWCAYVGWNIFVIKDQFWAASWLKYGKGTR